MLLYANPFAEGDDKYRLRTGDMNWSVFRDYVLRRHDDTNRKAWSAAHKEPRTVRARNQALFENARVLSDKLDAWLDGLAPEAELEKLGQLQDTLISRLEFVQVSVGSAPDAFLLFETLNDRGLQLSQGDLLKNHLLSRVASHKSASTDQIEQAAEEWDGLVDDLGPSVDLTRFLRHFLLASFFPVKKEEVFDRFKAQVASKGPLELLAEFREFGKLYGEFGDPATIEADADLQAQLHALSVLRAESCYPALLMARRYLSREDFLAFARLAEILTYRYSSVCGLDAKELQAGYHRAAKLLMDSKGLELEAARTEIEAMLPGTEQFLSAFRRQRMGAQYLARYTLQCVERALNPGKEFKGNDAVHLEHIMPQTLSDDWKASLGENLEDHPAFVQRWGNLTLLHAPLNIGASNGPFATKQVAYADSEVSITAALSDYLRWGLDAIDQRQEWMAVVADSIWSVNGFVKSAVAFQPLRIHPALEGLGLSERSRLEQLIPKSAPATPDALRVAIDDHTVELTQRGVLEAASLGESLNRVLNRWAAFGDDGRRLAVAAATYYVEMSDAADDSASGGLEDDLVVIKSACKVLSVEELLPED
jgi:hypothetical protein